MGALLVNKTALVVKAVDARLDMLLRNEPTHDVILTPIAGGTMGNKLPWYGSLYCMVATGNENDPVKPRAAIQANEFGGFHVLLGDSDSLTFPGSLHGQIKLAEFVDPTEAADVILAYFTTGKVDTHYRGRKTPKPAALNEERTLIWSTGDWDALITSLHLMGDHGFSEEQIDHCHDMLEYRPGWPEHIRTMKAYETPSGMMVLVINAYGIEFEQWFEPTPELLESLKGDINEVR